MCRRALAKELVARMNPATDPATEAVIIDVLPANADRFKIKIVTKVVNDDTSISDSRKLSANP
jgi:hypothetical protein